MGGAAQGLQRAGAGAVTSGEIVGDRELSIEHKNDAVTQGANTSAQNKMSRSEAMRALGCYLDTPEIRDRLSGIRFASDTQDGMELVRQHGIDLGLKDADIRRVIDAHDRRQSQSSHSKENRDHDWACVLDRTEHAKKALDDLLGGLVPGTNVLRPGPSAPMGGGATGLGPQHGNVRPGGDDGLRRPPRK